ILDTYDYDTEIIAASIRHLGHLEEAALAGAHIATVPVLSFLNYGLTLLQIKELRCFLQTGKNTKRIQNNKNYFTRSLQAGKRRRWASCFFKMNLKSVLLYF